MADTNIISILIKRSLQIYREDGVKGFLSAIKNYYQEYPPLRFHLYYWLYSKLKRSKLVVREVQGSKMYLDLNDFGLSKHLFFYGLREPECTSIMQQLVTPGMTIVELGANIGYYALMEAAIMKGSGKIYAIEPFPQNFEMLQKNIALNSYDKTVEAHHMAISNKSGVDKLYISNQHNLCNMLDSSAESFVEIKTETLDNFLKDKEQPDLIRMDIEGFEYYVIDGMKKTLQKKKSCKIFIELHPYQMFEKGLDYKKPVQQLFDLGFKPTYIVKEFGPLKEVSYEYHDPVEKFFTFLGEKKLTPPENTHGFGLFLEK